MHWTTNLTRAVSTFTFRMRCCTHRPSGLNKLPAHGRDARLSTSCLDDENYIMRMAEVYFDLNPHLRVCMKCAAEMK